MAKAHRGHRVLGVLLVVIVAAVVVAAIEGSRVNSPSAATATTAAAAATTAPATTAPAATTTAPIQAGQVGSTFNFESGITNNFDPNENEIPYKCSLPVYWIGSKA